MRGGGRRGSGSHRKPVLFAVSLTKAADAVVVGDERTAKLDRRGDQQTVGRVAIVKFGELIAAHRGI